MKHSIHPIQHMGGWVVKNTFYFGVMVYWLLV